MAAHALTIFRQLTTQIQNAINDERRRVACQQLEFGLNHAPGLDLIIHADLWHDLSSAAKAGDITAIQHVIESRGFAELQYQRHYRNQEHLNRGKAEFRARGLGASQRFSDDGPIHAELAASTDNDRQPAVCA